MLDPGGTPADPWHGWLPAVFPADAKRVRVQDPDLAATLKDAGAEFVDERPDVEIGPVDRLHGDASQAISSLGTAPPEGRSRVRRRARRLLGSLRLRGRAHRVRREVRRLGYTDALVITWDLEHVLQLPWRTPPDRVRIVERLPLRAIVLGRRRPSGPTVFEAALEGARTAAEIPLLDEPPVVRAALLLAIGQEEVLRVAIGPASHQLHDQRTALEALRAAKPPRAVAKRVPWPVAHGQAGLGNWSLEKRVAGTGTSTAPTGQLLADCVEFLVALHRAAAGGGGGQSLARDAETVANACKSRASEVRWLAKQVERELTEVQRGFGHGDFWGGNLLRDGARLTGVVDWTTAGPNRLPLMDLLHLHVSSKRWLTNGHLGPVLTNETLPWAREGGRSDDVRDYCRRIDLELTSKQVEALVVAYWLDRIGYELRTFTDRTRPSWVEQNVDAVLDTVLSGGYGFDS